MENEFDDDPGNKLEKVLDLVNQENVQLLVLNCVVQIGLHCVALCWVDWNATLGWVKKWDANVKS